MEIFQTIWNSLLTPNDTLISIITILFAPVEAFVSMNLFTTLLNIETNKKKKLLYVLIVSVLGILIRFIIPDPIATFTNILVMFLSTFFIFKTGILKSIFSQIIPFIVTVVLETICSKIFVSVFDIPYSIALNTILTRILLIGYVYLFMFILAVLAKHFNFSIKLFENINPKNRKTLIAISILGIVAIGTQLYVTFYYSEILPVGITLLSTIALISYFLISLYNLTKTNQLEVANKDIENLQLYNKTLSILHDNIRAFKHDFNNIVQAIGGYVATKDMDGLSKYYNQLLGDCQRVNNLNSLSPEVINNPSIYGILASKYHIADEKGIKINLEVFIDLNTLNMKIYEFSRIIGILLDNSIEATQECEEKIINIQFRNDNSRNRQLFIIENTYMNKDVDTIEIFNKGFSTKKNNSGLGLWEVNQILNKNTNLSLFTHKKGDYFVQQLEIYKE